MKSNLRKESFQPQSSEVHEEKSAEAKTSLPVIKPKKGKLNSSAKAFIPVSSTKVGREIKVNKRPSSVKSAEFKSGNKLIFNPRRVAGPKARSISESKGKYKPKSYK